MQELEEQGYPVDMAEHIVRTGSAGSSMRPLSKDGSLSTGGGSRLGTGASMGASAGFPRVGSRAGVGGPQMQGDEFGPPPGSRMGSRGGVGVTAWSGGSRPGSSSTSEWGGPPGATQRSAPMGGLVDNSDGGGLSGVQIDTIKKALETTDINLDSGKRQFSKVEIRKMLHPDLDVTNITPHVS